MPDYTTIDPNTLLPGEPWTSAKALAAFENIEAAFGGAPGAPRLQFAALDTWYSTAGAVGSYVFARRIVGNTDVAFGATLAGNSLAPVSATASMTQGSTSEGTASFVQGAALSGTWRCMGQLDFTVSSPPVAYTMIGATLWLRIA